MWSCNRFLSEYSISTLSVLFRKLSSFLHLMSLVPEEQIAKAWKPSTKNGGINTWSPETLEQSNYIFKKMQMQDFEFTSVN